MQRLEAVEREAQRLETIREAANKERRRLLHTRTGKVDMYILAEPLKFYQSFFE